VRESVLMVELEGEG